MRLLSNFRASVREAVEKNATTEGQVEETLQPLGPPVRLYRVLKLHGRLPIALLIVMAGTRPREFVQSIENLQRGGFAALDNETVLDQLRELADNVENNPNEVDTDSLVYSFTNRARQRSSIENCKIELVK